MAFGKGLQNLRMWLPALAEIYAQLTASRGLSPQILYVWPSQMTGGSAGCAQGVAELPSEEQMEAAISAQHKFNRKQFTQVKRHALMVSASAAWHAVHHAFPPEHKRCHAPIVCD